MRDGDGPRFRSVTDRAPCICAYLRVASCLHLCVTAASNTITILHVLLIAVTTTSIIDNITTVLLRVIRYLYMQRSRRFRIKLQFLPLDAPACYPVAVNLAARII